MPISIELREDNGIWEWDIRWPGPPQMRSTGCGATLREALTAVADDVLAISGER